MYTYVSVCCHTVIRKNETQALLFMYVWVHVLFRIVMRECCIFSMKRIPEIDPWFVTHIELKYIMGIVSFNGIFLFCAEL